MMRMILGQTINQGGLVLCDACNNDGDEVKKDGTPKYLGGIITVGGSALCPECCGDTPDREIAERLDPGKSFGDNVRDYRIRETGSSDGITMIFYEE